MRYLYVFVDESGNYDFSPTGTRHLVLTSLMCTDVTIGVEELHQLKHEMIDRGIDLEYFHAAEDRQVVRDGVFDIIRGLRGIRADAVVVDKCMTAPSIRQPRWFYPKMVEILLKYPFNPRGIDIEQWDKVLIFLDRAGSRKKERDALIKALKSSLPQHLRGVPYEILMHQSASHPHLQIVDYVSWAIYEKWERSECRPYESIRRHIKSEFPVFRHGHTRYYDHPSS